MFTKDIQTSIDNPALIDLEDLPYYLAFMIDTLSSLLFADAILLNMPTVAGPHVPIQHFQEMMPI